MGMVPTLQCRLCLCLYHYECIGLSPHVQIQAYVCKVLRKSKLSIEPEYRLELRVCHDNVLINSSLGEDWSMSCAGREKKTTTPKKLSELIRTLLSAVCLREGRVDERRREQPTTKQ